MCIRDRLTILATLKRDNQLNLQQAFLFSTMAWISVAFFGSIPFFLSNLGLNFSEAFFESMSGITTTGATIISDLDNSPKSILLWRAIMQWLGGIGVIAPKVKPILIELGFRAMLAGTVVSLLSATIAGAIIG